MRVNVIAFSTSGCRTAHRVAEALKGEDVRLYAKTSSDTLDLEKVEIPGREWTESSFRECDAIVFIGAIGIAVRYIAPFVERKDRDPAVVCLDEHGRFTVSLLSGHIGGGNRLAQRIADGIGSTPVITTATDINGKFSVDSFAVANGLRISSLAVAKEVSARVLDGRFVGFSSEIPVDGEVPDGITPADGGEFGVRISRNPEDRPFGTTLSLTPMDISVGVGCRRGTDPDRLRAFISEILAEERIAPERVCAVASIDIKSDEEAILSLARRLGVPAKFYSSGELMSLQGEFSSSKFVRQVTEVDCVCERSAVAAEGGRLIRRKTARDGMTVALCEREIHLRFV